MMKLQRISSAGRIDVCSPASSFSEVSNLQRNSAVAALSRATSSSMFELEVSDVVTATPACQLHTRLRHPVGKSKSFIAGTRFSYEQAHSKHQMSSPVVRSLHTACEPRTGLPSQLALELKSLVRNTTVSSAPVETLASLLLGLGYQIQLRDGFEGSLQDTKQNFLKDLRGHRYMICTGYEPSAFGGGGDGDGGGAILLTEPLIVEPRFREQFVINFGLTNFTYQSLLLEVPTIFVGPLSQLESVVSILASEIKASFEGQSRPLPPWRTKRAILSKWAPDQLRELADLLQKQALQSDILGAAGDHGSLCGDDNRLEYERTEVNLLEGIYLKENENNEERFESTQSVQAISQGNHEALRLSQRGLAARSQGGCLRLQLSHQQHEASGSSIKPEALIAAGGVKVGEVVTPPPSAVSPCFQTASAAEVEMTRGPSVGSCIKVSPPVVLDASNCKSLQSNSTAVHAAVHAGQCTPTDCSTLLDETFRTATMPHIALTDFHGMRVRRMAVNKLYADNSPSRQCPASSGDPDASLAGLYDSSLLIKRGAGSPPAPLTSPIKPAPHRLLLRSRSPLQIHRKTSGELRSWVQQSRRAKSALASALSSRLAPCSQKMPAATLHIASSAAAASSASRALHSADQGANCSASDMIRDVGNMLWMEGNPSNSSVTQEDETLTVATMPRQQGEAQRPAPAAAVGSKVKIADRWCSRINKVWWGTASQHQQK
ncbi:hypothetical protein CEUSTIGMA_g8442.t1 [Chlamydomonas eustigma]|uniref:Uncharacterized protein n=1 Tax=Chlamydomonas eustigma TaxID=1157962 RepID=A0A250XD41_9CHLO|nr:hypothetical protein CEUSTIGMA_g8442.t1 [Chlamydomonas eustigma]|eukprot:GAX81007.1 hypothetical protein CEUSTIGMA_g8442.t1 [Chlamydomonas eustigma]